MQSHIKESHGSICGAAGDESHHQRMFGTKLACPVSQFPPAVVKGHSGYQPVPSHIPYPCSLFHFLTKMGTNLSQPISLSPQFVWVTLVTDLSLPVSHSSFPFPFAFPIPHFIFPFSISHSPFPFPHHPSWSVCTNLSHSRPSSLPPQLARGTLGTKLCHPTLPVPCPPAGQGTFCVPNCPCQPRHLPSPIKAPLFSPQSLNSAACSTFPGQSSHSAISFPPSVGRCV